MKKILLSLLSCLLFLSPSLLKGQTFTVPSDTVTADIVTTGVINDNITNITSASINIKWKVIASDFPMDWLVDTAFNICDNSLCRSNNNNMWLWNGSVGTAFTAPYASSIAGIFDLTLNLIGTTSTGCHYVTVKLDDEAHSYSKNITFVVCKLNVAVPTVTNKTYDINVYPNPAQNETTLSFQLADYSAAQVQIVDGLGRVVSTVANEKMDAGVHTYTLNTSALATGIYNVMIKTEGGISTKRLNITK